jgi:hypothetical protein
VPVIFFGNGVKGEVDFILVRLLGPFLCDISALYIDSLSFLWFPYLLNRFSLHEEDSFGYVHVTAALELYWFSQHFFGFPVDFWVEIVEEGVSKNDVILS